jgi:hypothetical protein
VITYRDVIKLGKDGAIDLLDCPEWLRQEIAKFTPKKWLQYWHARTGRKKITSKKVLKKRRAKASKNSPSKPEHSKSSAPSKKERVPVGSKQNISRPLASSDTGKSARPTIIVSLKKTESSTVKQSFSHGRTKSVVVEKKRATALLSRANKVSR